jgi:hypothetical protein
MVHVLKITVGEGGLLRRRQPNRQNRQPNAARVVATNLNRVNNPRMQYPG